MAVTKLELAKSRIALHAGWMLSLTSKLEWISMGGIGTAGTDGRNVYYDPEFIEKLTLAQTIGLVVHETWHNMFSHPARLGDRQPQLANIAMDVVANAQIVEFFEQTPQLKGELPPGGVPVIEKYKGWNWEKVYADLYEIQQQQGGKGKIPKQFDNVTPGTNPDGSRMTPEQLAELAREWQMAAQQAVTMAKQRGNVPGFMQDMIADMVRPKINWQAEVWDEFKRISKDESSWRRFNRRFVHNELYLPGLYSEHIGRVACYVDTSGSMGSEEFKLAIGLLNEIFEDVRPTEILFVQCDTRIVSEELITPDDLPLVAKEFKGRGGTELTPMFKHNLKQEVEPEMVVVLTDGYHEVIDAKYAPHCRTLWLITTDHVDSAQQSFGKVVQVRA